MSDFLPISLLLALYLLPCAVQDWRWRQVSNWLTVPAFVVAWPLALWLGGEERLVFAFAVFAGCWLAWQMGSMGAADGKLATLLAAVQPVGLMAAGGLLALTFLLLRLRGRAGRVPGVVGLYGGAILAAMEQMISV